MLRWFPDKPGLATGAAVMGFGGGAVVAAPLMELLLDRFSKPPELLGTAETVPLVRIIQCFCGSLSLCAFQ